MTENYSSKFNIMCLWVPALKSPAENSIPKKSLDTSQLVLDFYLTHSFSILSNLVIYN